MMPMSKRVLIYTVLFIILALIISGSINGQDSSEINATGKGSRDSLAGAFKADIDSLAAENIRLKKSLAEYQKFEEDFTAKKVFEKARKQLLIYITLGGIIIVLAGVIGIKTLRDYAKNLAQKKIESISDKEVKGAMLKEGNRQITAFAKEIEAEFIGMVQQQMSRIITSSEPISYIEKPETLEKPPPPVSMLDYSDQMLPVRNQGPEGGSTAFAAAAALQYQIKRFLRKSITISPRYIYYYSRLKMGDVKVDSGAHLKDAAELLHDRGAVAEDVWPYIPGEYAVPPPREAEGAEHYKIAYYESMGNLNDLKSALKRFGPIIGAMYIFLSIRAADKTGLVPMPRTNERPWAGHAVCFVGFDDVKRLLKFRNSWGIEWGDNGHGYISYDYAERYLLGSWAISLEEPK